MATPLGWDELGRADPRRYTVENLFKRLARKDDPWEGLDRGARSLRGPPGRLEGLREEAGRG